MPLDGEMKEVIYRGTVNSNLSPIQKCLMDLITVSHWRILVREKITAEEMKAFEELCLAALE